MTPMVFILVLIGVCYVSELLMRFIVWLDGADECEEDAPTAERVEERVEARTEERATARERRRAA